jgi:hypothetical protein
MQVVAQLLNHKHGHLCISNNGTIRLSPLIYDKFDANVKSLIRLNKILFVPVEAGVSLISPLSISVDSDLAVEAEITLDVGDVKLQVENEPHFARFTIVPSNSIPPWKTVIFDSKLERSLDQSLKFPCYLSNCSEEFVCVGYSQPKYSEGWGRVDLDTNVLCHPLDVRDVVPMPVEDLLLQNTEPVDKLVTFVKKCRTASSVLLIGRPASGKSIAVAIAAKKLCYRLLRIQCTEKVSDLNAAVLKAMELSRCILLLEDIQNFRANLASCLQRVPSNVVIVLTCSNPEKMESRLMSLFSFEIRCPPASSHEAKLLLQKYVSEFGLNISLTQQEEFLSATQGFLIG